VNSDPKGPENRPHYYIYKLPFYPQEDTVVASEKSKPGVEASPHSVSQAPRVRQNEQKERPVRTDSGTVMKLTTDELVKLAPRLKPYLRNAAPGWPEIVEAADWLRHDLGVSKPLWGEACLAMGREQAAVALAIVSAKPPEHFTASPGGYFYGMVNRAKAGTLNLSRTVWGLRNGRAGGQVGEGSRATRQ
jgi:replication initiation protein RepC